jgi:NTE family protein
MPTPPAARMMNWFAAVEAKSRGDEGMWAAVHLFVSSLDFGVRIFTRVSTRLTAAFVLEVIASSFLFSLDGRCAEAAEAQTAGRHPRIALVLSGGAARGAAHVGVLKTLEENRIPVHFVAGTSIGAIVGGLYASGLSPEEMNRMFTSADWNDLFTDRPSRKHLSFRRKEEDLESLIRIEMGWKHGITFPASLVAGDKLIFYLRKISLHTHGTSSFDELPIPFRAVATDLESGEMVVLRKGDLAEALRASMAIPGAFAPQEIDGRLLVDGFLTQNLPVSVARDWGADVIIAVDVGAPLYTREELNSILNLAGQTLGMMSRRNTTEQIALLRAQDILIQPHLGTVRSLDFGRSAETVGLGEVAAKQAIHSLRRYSVSEQEYAEWQKAQRRRTTETIRIDRVRVEKGSVVPDRTIERRAGLKPGTELKPEELRQSLNRIYDVGAFDVVDFKLVQEIGSTDLVIRPRERETGPIRVRMGLKLFSDLDADSDFNFLTSVTATELNRLGAEWKNQVQFGRTTRISSEWYQPLEYGRRYFIAPHAQFLQDRAESELANGDLVRAKFRRFDGGVDAGVQLGNYGELRVGPLWGHTRIYELRGLSVPGGLRRITQAGGHVRLTLDQIDNVDFPRSGYLGGLELFSSREELGADLNYNRLAGSWFQAFSFGENTLLGGISFGAKLGPDLPFYETFAVGGFLNLSGFPFESLADQYATVGRLVYYRRVLRFNTRVIDAVYVGGSAETGGVWHRFDDINARDLIFAGSIFVGVETSVGPLYLAYGRAEGGNQAFYFYLGRWF